MQKLMRFSHNHPVVTILVLLAISIGAALQLPGLVIDPSMEGLRSGDPVGKANYQLALDEFGSDKINIVYIRDQHLFKPEKLALVEELVFALEELPGILRAESLFSVNNFKNEDGMLVTGPLADWVPETMEEAKGLLEDALNNPMVSGDLVSASGQSIAINLLIDPEHQGPNSHTPLVTGIDSLLQPLGDQFEEIFQIGEPTLRYEISHMMLKDQKQITPLSVLVLLITLALVTRSVACAALPLLTSFTSILWIAGFMSLTGIPVNILTVIVPSLILVIGSTEDVHLLLEYEEGLHEKGGRPLAIAWMIQKMGMVVLVLI